VIAALERLGFKLLRQGNHISMIRENPDGTNTTLTIPNHPTIKKSTLRTILTRGNLIQRTRKPETVSWIEPKQRALTPQQAGGMRAIQNRRNPQEVEDSLKLAAGSFNPEV
jgi:predicted RNA binding protein YcfA (HicA-like mRNA interferase family)